MSRQRIGVVLLAVLPACVSIAGLGDYAITDAMPDAGEASSTPPSGTTPGAPPPMQPPIVVDAAPTCTGKKIVILGDGTTASTDAAKTLLEADTFLVTVVADYSTGELPALDGFASILLLTGKTYPVMPEGVSTAIVNANAAGVGLVLEEWSSWGKFIDTTGRFAALEPVFVYQYEAWANGQHSFAPKGDHPVWSGLPSSFASVGPLAVGTGSLLDGGVAIGQSMVTDGGTLSDAVFVRDGAGRVAETSIASNYDDENSLATDPNIARLYLNMVEWTARCR